MHRYFSQMCSNASVCKYVGQPRFKAVNETDVQLQGVSTSLHTQSIPLSKVTNGFRLLCFYTFVHIEGTNINIFEPGIARFLQIRHVAKQTGLVFMNMDFSYRLAAHHQGFRLWCGLVVPHINKSLLNSRTMCRLHIRANICAN